MRDDMREKLNTEITRKQFLQYLTGAALMVFGLDNLIGLITGRRPGQRVFIHNTPSNGSHGFGSSKFGV